VQYDFTVALFHIDNVNDDRLAAFRSVPDPELLRLHGLFAAEGRLVVRRLLASTRLTTCAVMVTPTALTALAELHTDRGFPVYVVPQSVMNTVGGFNFHRGCLALGKTPPSLNWHALLGHSSRLVVLEGVSNPDNVGAIFRNAAAFGVDGVLLEEGCADPLYRKAIRTSMAASLSVPFATAPCLDVLGAMREQGWVTVGMTPGDDATNMRDVAAEVARRRVAIVLGHEGHGLMTSTLSACTHRARIEMSGEVDSVNVATAAAIAMYEFVRGSLPG
jgi:tRNA G18 (ribose-2'-O)-methylase SpoU